MKKNNDHHFILHFGYLSIALSFAAFLVPETHQYFYAGDSIYRKAESYLLGSSADTMLVNDQDLVLYDKKSDELSDPVVVVFQYSPISQLIHKLKNDLSTDSYIYENGDLIRDIQYSDTTKLTYDSSRLAVRGNMDEFYTVIYNQVTNLVRITYTYYCN